MAKHVFKPTEFVNISRKIFIEPPIIEVEEPEEIAGPLNEAAISSGPSAEDIEKLQRKADEFKKSWEKEKNRMVEQAKKEAEQIIKNAENVAFEEVKRKNNQSKKIKQEAEEDAERILNEAREKAVEIENSVNTKVSNIEKDAHDKGYREGHEQGYDVGKQEVARLVDRLHIVLTSAIDKRNEIIENSETQLVNLVLLIAKKVIKVISENQKNVVINNVIQALRKLKSRGNVVIRVSLADLELTTEHTKDFLNMVENVKSITILEDSSVDKGGCIIETDFGQIDARISSQINEIEEKILELIPIKSIGRD